MLESAIEHLEAIIARGGPDLQDYRDLVKTFDLIFRHEFVVQNGVSSRIHRSHNLEAFFSKYRSIFRTTGSMQGFAYAKPHGYAGDFEIIEKIYRENVSRKQEIIKWDNFFHTGSASNAVRNRAALLSSLIVKYNPTDILSVGCGPALDIVGADGLLTNSPNIDLLDNDLSALDRAKINTLPYQEYYNYIGYHHKNALRFRTEKRFDFIWSSGLFDYLNDKTAVFLLKRLKALLKPNAFISIGNFSHDNASRSYMELVGEWFLIHRSREDLLNIAIASGFASKDIDLTVDDTGLNIFLVARNS